MRPKQKSNNRYFVFFMDIFCDGISSLIRVAHVWLAIKDKIVDFTRNNIYESRCSFCLRVIVLGNRSGYCKYMYIIFTLKYLYFRESKNKLPFGKSYVS